MTFARTCAGLAAAIVAGLLGTAAAQQFPPPPPSASSPTVQQRWPDLPKTPAQRAAPAATPQNAQQPAQQAAPSNQEERLQTPEHKPAPKPTAHAPALAVTCGGVFAKDSSHLKLAMKYDSRNVVFGQVDGPDGSKIPASILYPNDPRRRLEVLWNNQAGRSDTQVIAINGKSQWGAPKGLKLGLALAALEKMNGRPFKLSGFGADGAALVLGWEDGALGSLPGGCNVGVRLFEDPKAPEEARNAVAGDKELSSNEPSLRAVRPTVGEILIGY
jgi:hypothetical protein